MRGSRGGLTSKIHAVVDTHGPPARLAEAVFWLKVAIAAALGQSAVYILCYRSNALLRYSELD